MGFKKYFWWKTKWFWTHPMWYLLLVVFFMSSYTGWIGVGMLPSTALFLVSVVTALVTGVVASSMMTAIDLSRGYHN